VHGHEGGDGLLKVKLRSGQVGRTHLLELLRSGLDEFLPAILDSAGYKLEKVDLENLKHAFRRMSSESLLEFARNNPHDWLVEAMVKDTQNRGLLSALVAGHLRDIKSGKYVRLARKRLQQIA
jgi:hypothetical protein